MYSIGGGGRREVQGGGDKCIHNADSLHCTAETSTTLKRNYTPIKQNETGRTEGAALIPITWCQLQTQRKRCTLHLQQDEAYCVTTQQEEGRISPSPVTAQPTEVCHNSTNEKSLQFKLFVSSNGLFVYNSPSQLPHLHYKSMLPSLVLRSCLWFANDCISWIIILCCSQINPFCW